MTREELLSAYLDGALDPAQQAEMERNLEHDPALAEDLARLMRNDGLLRAAIAEQAGPEDGPALAARYDLVLPAQAASTPPANDNRRWRWAAGLAAAAAVMGGLMFVPAGLWQRGGGSTGFDGALDRTVSLQQARLDDGRTLVPRLSFRATDGGYCREYQLAAGDRIRAGLACRRGEKWNVLVEEPASVMAKPSNEIDVAGGDNSPKLDEAYRRIAASDPFDATQEQALIAAGWTGAKKSPSAE